MADPFRLLVIDDDAGVREYLQALAFFQQRQRRFGCTGAQVEADPVVPGARAVLAR